MLLTVLCALMGAYLGMAGRNRLTAVLLAAVIAGAAWHALLYGTAFLVAFAPEPLAARRMLSAWGAPGPSLANVVLTAAVSALIAGLLAAFVAPADTPGRRKRRGATGIEV